MVDMESTVAVTQPDSVSDDAVQDQATVETEQSALEQFLMDEPPEQDAGTAEQTEETANVQNEEAPVSKGIRGRIQAAETKADKAGYDRGRMEAMREFEAYKAEMDAKLQKFYEYEIDMEARELARTEKCSLELAKRIVRAEKGISAPVKAETQIQTKTEETPVKTANTVEVRANELMNQANKIKAEYGIDTLEIFKNDAEVRKKVGSGEWDMKDVLIHTMNKPKETRPAAPRPVRASATRSVDVGNISKLSNEDWEKFNQKIAKGAVYRAK